MDKQAAGGKPPVDLDQVRSLVAALEADLARAGTDSRALESLRAEARALGDALGAQDPDEQGIARALHRLHRQFDGAVDAVVAEAVEVADYAQRIAAMLGL